MNGDSDLNGRKLARAALQRWAAPAKPFISQTIFVQALAAVGWVGLAWGIGHAVAAIAAGENPNRFLLTAFAGVTLRTILQRLGEASASKAGLAMTAAAREDIFAAIARSGAAVLSGAASGERTAQIIDRTAKLSRYAGSWLPGMRLAAIAPLILLIAAGAQSWVVAFLFVVSVIVLPLFIWLTASRTAEAAQAQQSALDGLSGAFQTASAHAGLIRAFRSIGRETETLRAASEDLRTRTMSILRTAFLTSAVLEFFASISIALVAVYVGFKLLGVFPFPTGETLTLAEGLTALILAPEYFAPIRRLSGLHHDRGDGAAAAGMIAPWLNASAQAPAIKRLPKCTTPPRIRFSDVALAYGDGAVAVCRLSFDAAPGQIVALTGPSGSGKSTCLLALIGRAQLREGRIEVDGRALVSGESIADSTAFLRQAPWLIDGTLADNIALANPNASRAQVEAAASEAGVTDFARKDPEGLDRRLERFGAGLSGGQKQRIALARGILRDAPLWLADEPTAHLDGAGEAEFIATLRRLSSGRTILIATHSEALIAACDQVILMPCADQQRARA